jgi:putative tricarboxylic transport membrane protein
VKSETKTSKYHTIIFVFWIGLGLFLMIFSSQKLGLGALRTPGPGLMPFLIGGFLILLSLYHLIATLRGDGSTEELLEERRHVAYRKLSIVVGSLILYGLFLERLGFIVDTFLLLSFLFWEMGSRWKSALLTSVLTVLVTYLVFTYFGLRFPAGLLRLAGFY